MENGCIAVQTTGYSNTNGFAKDLNHWAHEKESQIQDGGDDCKISYFTVSTMYTRDMKRLERNAEKYGWKISILGLEQNRKDLGWEDENKEKGIKGENYGDFSLKLNGLNDFIKDKKDDDIVLWTDAWDVVVLDTCANMYGKYKKFDKAIVFSAEKYCSPDASKRDLYDTLDTKFPFLCAGMFIGRVDKLKYLMTFYKGEKINDQVFWTDMYLKNKDLIALDNNAEMFLSTWDTDGKYYEFKDNRFTYTDTSTSPVFIHANGNIKDKLRLFEDYFNLGIEHAYVVNLEERKSKWDQIQEEFKHTNFFLERFNAIKDEVGHKGCGKSYQAIIRMAKEKNMDSVLIFDDDCKPLDKFNERWILVKKWLNDNNEKWEIFNGGLKIVQGSETQLIGTIDENNRILTIHKGIHTQMVLYKKESYDRILEWDYDKNWLIDFNYINTNKFKTVYVEPPLTMQKEGFSDTEGYHKEQTGGKRTYKKQSGGAGETLHYITVSTKDTPELQRLIKSAKKYNLTIDVLGLELNRNNGGHKQPLNDNLKGGKFGIKLRYPKEYLKDKNPDDILLFTDAWDVVVANNPNSLLEKYKKFNKDIVFSAENALWPDDSRESNYKNSKDEPFPYINSGGYIGKVGVIRDLLNNYNGEDIDDQRFWTDIYFKNRDKIVLDTKAEIFLSMHAINHEDLLFDNNVFTYKETGTQPIIAHGNGMSKDLIKIFTEKLQIGGKRKHNKTKKKNIRYKKTFKNKKGGGNSTELIIKSVPTSGFFSNFNKLITYLTDHPDITKITFNMFSTAPNTAFSFIKEGEELFSKLFEVYDEQKPITNTIIGEIYENERITGKNASNYYNENRNNLQPFHDAYIKYIKIKPELQNKINDTISELKKDSEQLIGIFIRSNSLAGEQPSGKMPRREEYDSAIDKIDKSKKTKYFLCIDNEDDLEYFKNKYQPNYYTDIRRSSNKNDGEAHVNTVGGLDQLEKSFIEVVLLSSCDTLIHCVSNMVTASLYMNMNQKSIFVQNL